MTTRLVHRLRPAWQIGLLVPFWLAGQRLSSALRLPIPGSLVGMGLLLVALQARVVRAEWLEEGAAWLFRHMLLFFIPAAVGVIEFPALLGREGLRVLAVIAASTALVMAATGLAVEWAARRRAGGRG